MNFLDLAPLAVVLPIFGAGAAFLVRRRIKLQRLITIGILCVTLLLEAGMLAAVWGGESYAVHIGGWQSPWGISLMVDGFSAFMLLISTLVSLAVLFYATSQGLADGDEPGPVSVFHPAYLILLAGVSNAFLAADLFNLYVGFEILLTASYVLLTLGATAERIRAGTTYVVVSVVSSVIFLMGIAMTYAATGTVNMADLAVKLPQLDQGPQLILHVLLLIAFGIKAAVFPLSLWLPDSYPTAPAPVTAVFAGLLTKVGVYAIVRTETLLFPGGAVNAGLLVVAALTMVIGILGAIAQTDFKRMLSFTLTSHIGYLIFGVAVGGELAIAATIYYVGHHIIVQTSLFMVAGLIERRAGSANVTRLGSLAKLSPALSLLFFIPAINLGGIPPFSGFLGKFGLLHAAAQDADALTWVVIAAGLLTSLLTLLAIIRVWARMFWRRAADAEIPNPDLVDEAAKVADQTAAGGAQAPHLGLKLARELESEALPWGMRYATGSLVVAGIALTVFAGPIFEFCQRVAAQLIAHEPYINAILSY
ncbi:Na+/H+ antiporter subunit D [Glutamicibacter soli]|uniref:Na+/H+ antiporter subunit D n=1 Tax=Glutamicibacter soli TaxID=453836 RepID=A0A365YE45_9MICC|nr:MULTISPECIES: Na+/H+ antiporter subunit D [Micrococcaceae]ALD64705.1 monovalent cation/H+ antiporter subunit D [Arthrobacter sp. LS16]ALQ29949.1 cation:proton antiporter [Arthrobacter sp. YC-RL1]KLI88711.1 monovalent cation/H+ antiporter subunit D [Arthrobacter sp. YC-RL1]NAZ15240.1 Na+/H+ antiporter subunit D [Glutamicibacter soli]RBM00667.1 Na+/H+ antiporter subunit D [Glutamicibacter soli]